MELKTCSRCKISKEIEMFPLRTPNGRRRGVCKDCINERNKERYANGYSEYHVNYRTKNREKHIEYCRNYDKNHIEERRKYVKENYHLDKATGNPKHIRERTIRTGKVQANEMVKHGLKTGKLIRPNICSNCPETQNIHAHHDSYLMKDRLNIRWLCAKCHRRFHVENKINVIIIDIKEIIFPHITDNDNIIIFTDAVKAFPSRHIPNKLSDIQRDIYSKVFTYLYDLDKNIIQCEYGKVTKNILAISAIIKTPIYNLTKKTSLAQ